MPRTSLIKHHGPYCRHNYLVSSDIKSEEPEYFKRCAEHANRRLKYKAAALGTVTVALSPTVILGAAFAFETYDMVRRYRDACERYAAIAEGVFQNVKDQRISTVNVQRLSMVMKDIMASPISTLVDSGITAATDYYFSIVPKPHYDLRPDILPSYDQTIEGVEPTLEGANDEPENYYSLFPEANVTPAAPPDYHEAAVPGYGVTIASTQTDQITERTTS